MNNYNYLNRYYTLPLSTAEFKHMQENCAASCAGFSNMSNNTPIQKEPFDRPTDRPVMNKYKKYILLNNLKKRQDSKDSIS